MSMLLDLVANEIGKEALQLEIDIGRENIIKGKLLSHDAFHEGYLLIGQEDTMIIGEAKSYKLTLVAIKDIRAIRFSSSSTLTETILESLMTAGKAEYKQD